MKSSKRPVPSARPVASHADPAEDPGYMVSGPGFYVWREHHSEALRAAAELAGSLTPDQAQRLARRSRGDAPDDEASG